MAIGHALKIALNLLRDGQAMVAGPKGEKGEKNMKETLKIVRWKTTLALVALAAAPALAQAAEAGTASATNTSDLAGLVQPVLDTLLGKYGWLAAVVAGIGALRIVFKPLMLALESYVAATKG